MDHEKPYPGDEPILKTWKWEPEDDPALPPPEIPRFYCRAHVDDRKLTPFDYHGQILYVCRHCGDVYWIDEAEPLQDKLNIWPGLFRQPYYWKKTLDAKASLSRALLFREGEITDHPFLDRHCSGDPREALDCLLRYLIAISGNEFRNAFFTGKAEHCSVSREDARTLTVTEGRPELPFPDGQYHVYRESADRLIFEASTYNYWCDMFFPDEEAVETWDHLSCTISFLGTEEAELPPHVPRSAPRADSDREQWISTGPFGLDGFYLFERECTHLREPNDEESY